MVSHTGAAPGISRGRMAASKKDAKRGSKKPSVAPPSRKAAPAPRAPRESDLTEALRLSEARFAGIVGISADAIVSVDESQRIVFFNAGAEKVFGYRATEVLGEPLSFLLPPRVRELHTGHVTQFAHGAVPARHMGARSPIEGRRKSGEIFPAEASISQVDLGGAKLFTAVLRDVTERARLLAAANEARAAAEAAETRARFLAEAGAALDQSLDYETTLATLASLVVPFLADCSIIDVLDAGGNVQRVGLAHVDPAMRGVVEQLRTYPRATDRPFITRRAITTGEIERVDHVTREIILALSQDEDHFGIASALAPASFIVIPLRVREHVIGAMAFLRCGTPRPYADGELALASELARRAAQAVENARLYGAARSAIRARDDVLAVVSHDLRNPLSAISMCTTTLLEQPPADDAMRREMLDMVQQSVEWMHRIIQDLLDIASIEAGKLSVHRGRTPVAEIQALARPSLEALTSNHRFDFSIAPGTPAVEADSDRLAQVLVNLVGNSAKFTPPQGEISVRVAPDGERRVRFTVRDAGSGIPAGDLPHVFDRFWHARGTARTAGSGLGLAIAKGIVEAHQGEIWAESVVGIGSTFSFTIPSSN